MTENFATICKLIFLVMITFVCCIALIAFVHHFPLISFAIIGIPVVLMGIAGAWFSFRDLWKDLNSKED